MGCEYDPIFAVTSNDIMVIFHVIILFGRIPPLQFTDLSPESEADFPFILHFHLKYPFSPSFAVFFQNAWAQSLPSNLWRGHTVLEGSESHLKSSSCPQPAGIPSSPNPPCPVSTLRSFPELAPSFSPSPWPSTSRSGLRRHRSALLPLDHHRSLLSNFWPPGFDFQRLDLFSAFGGEGLQG